MNHRDWVRFLDSEIVDVLPDKVFFSWLFPRRKTRAWKDLSESVGYIGGPPKSLISRGLILA